MSFRKQNINIDKSLTQTEALAVQTAPDLKEIILSAMMRASGKKVILCALCSCEEHMKGRVCEDFKETERIFSGNKDICDLRNDKTDIIAKLSL